MYKAQLVVFPPNPSPVCVNVDADGIRSSVPFDPANMDYQRFKREVMDGAELKDADGNLMSQAYAEAFVSTLP